MKFCIVVPSGRYRKSDEMGYLIGNFVGMLYESLTMPTDVLVLDGRNIHNGKVAALNDAMKNNPPQNYDVWCTFDDDIQLERGWQDEITQAFEVWHEFSAFGFDWSHTPEGAAYMMEVNNIVERNGIKVRPLHTYNIAGAAICARGHIVQQIGAIPNRGTLYDPTEDGWRGGQFRARGKTGYLVLEKPANLLMYPDTQDYRLQKIKESRQLNFAHPDETAYRNDYGSIQ